MLSKSQIESIRIEAKETGKFNPYETNLINHAEALHIAVEALKQIGNDNWLQCGTVNTLLVSRSARIDKANKALDDINKLVGGGDA